MRIYIIFILFNFLVFFVGSTLSRVLFKNKSKLFNLPIESFHIPLGLFLIGNITFIYNFLFKINNYLYFVYLVLIILNLKNIKLKILKENSMQLLLIPSVLSTSFFDINLSYDAGLYHLQFQNWLKNYKIVTGFYNVNPRFGFSSIYEYISVNFYITENLIYLHFVSLFFLVFFFNIIYRLVIKLENFNYLGVFILIYLFMDNFGFSGGKNGFIEFESITNFDSAFAVIFFLTNFLIFTSYNVKLNSEELLLLNIFILFAVQLRIFGLILLFPYLLIFGFKKIKIQTEIIIISFFWLLKNILHSACLFYPVTFSCLPKLSWINIYKGNPYYMKEDIRNFHNSYSSSQNFNTWLNEWLEISENSIVIKNLFISYILLYIFKKIFFKAKSNNFIINLTILVYFVFWIFNAPGIRFGQGIFISTLFLFSCNIIELKPVFKKYKKLFINVTFIFGIFGFLMFPRISMYKNINLYSTPVIYAPIPEYSPNNQNFLINQLPSGEDQCWEIVLCAQYVNSDLTLRKNKLNYLIFENIIYDN